MADALPPPYQAWMKEILGKPLPREVEATCDHCAMLAEDARSHRSSSFFRPETKCCTYLPELPNFTVGRILAVDAEKLPVGRPTVEQRLAAGVAVTPLGLGWPEDYRRLYRDNPQWFGRNPMMRCPHYDAANGQCGIWRFRTAVCATWFCKLVRGAVGQRLWDSVRKLLQAVERFLVHHCLVELDSDGHVSRLFESVTAGGDSERSSDADWIEPVARFYRQCGELVAGLRWPEVVRMGGAELSRHTQVVKRAFAEHRSKKLPRTLYATTIQVTPEPDGHFGVTAYENLDPLRLPAELLLCLGRFDGRRVTEVLTELAEEGIELDRALVRKLVDFEILVPRSGAD